MLHVTEGKFGASITEFLFQLVAYWLDILYMKQKERKQ
jgi:hypothetical protein